MFLDETWLAKRIYTFENVEGVIERQESSSSIENCAICLENYSPEQEVILLECRHVFHKECGKKWFHDNSYCPFCRAAQDNRRQMISYGVWRRTHPDAPETDYPGYSDVED